MPSGTLYRVSAPHFVAGLIVQGGTVAQAAPILRWMLGKPLGEIEQYCQRKRWKFERVETWT